MVTRVLVVDDSSFFRKRLTQALNSCADLEVVAVAENGVEAIEKVQEYKPDVVTMDIQMPEMDGITAVRKIMSVQPTPILMFSSLTKENSEATFESLDAGAVDFLPKTFEDLASNFENAIKIIAEKVRAVAAVKVSAITATISSQTTTRDEHVQNASYNLGTKQSISNYKLIVIGSSTGGPVAVQEILTKLPKNFPVPLLLIQHMPAAFTEGFATRLDSICQINARQAEDGDKLENGLLLIAPGGVQLTVDDRRDGQYVSISPGNEEEFYKPSVNVCLASLDLAKAKDVLVIILTGMGADGCAGATELKKHGATIWAQDEESCVVFGMPGAVVKAGITDRILPLHAIGEILSAEV